MEPHRPQAKSGLAGSNPREFPCGSVSLPYFPFSFCHSGFTWTVETTSDGIKMKIDWHKRVIDIASARKRKYVRQLVSTGIDLGSTKTPTFCL